MTEFAELGELTELTELTELGELKAEERTTQSNRFWILDFGFWIEEVNATRSVRAGRPRSQ